MTDFEQKTFHILCVDDTPTNLILVDSLLKKHGYLVTTVNSGQEALNYLNRNPHIDLILMDISMPDMSGFEVCQRLKASDSERSKIPVIFLTAINTIDAVSKGFEVGGVDYLTKPVRPQELLVRIRTHLKLKFLQDQELSKTQEELVYMISALADNHCTETSKHVRRVGAYARLIAELLGFDKDRAGMIEMAAAMHDIGKVATPDHILHKPGKLTGDEFSVIQNHAQAGYDILKFSNLPLMKMAAIIAHQHHEKWDGTGYPQGLKGNEIHLLGRIVALADVLDALDSSRSYKKDWSMNDTFSIIKSERGRHFDPRMVDIFMDNFGLFMEIREQFTHGNELAIEREASNNPVPHDWYPDDIISIR